MPHASKNAQSYLASVPHNIFMTDPYTTEQLTNGPQETAVTYSQQFVSNQPVEMPPSFLGGHSAQYNQQPISITKVDGSQRLPDSLKPPIGQMQPIFTTLHTVNQDGAFKVGPDTALLNDRKQSSFVSGSLLAGEQLLVNQNSQRLGLNADPYVQRPSNQPDNQQTSASDIDILDMSDHSQRPVRTYKIPQASSLNKLMHRGHAANQKSNRSHMNVDIHSDLHKATSLKTTKQHTTTDANLSQNKQYYQHLQGIAAQNSQTVLGPGSHRKSAGEKSIGDVKPIVALHTHHVEHPRPGDISNNMTDARPVRVKEYRMATMNMQVMTNKAFKKASNRDIPRKY